MTKKKLDHILDYFGEKVYVGDEVIFTEKIGYRGKKVIYQKGIVIKTFISMANILMVDEEEVFRKSGDSIFRIGRRENATEGVTNE